MGRRASGFTLIEVLIVVVVMAILASALIPKFVDSTADAENTQVEFNLRILRSQIELYKVHHGDSYPAIKNDLEVLTARSDFAGTIDRAAGKFGPYVVEIPSNPRTNSATVSASTTGKESTGGGWLYDAATGSIWVDGPPDSD